MFMVGDATVPTRSSGRLLVAHICNNKGGWGKGFVVPLGTRYPKAKEAYKATQVYGLGTVQYVLVSRDPEVFVANMIAQNGYHNKNNPHPLDLEALRLCLRNIAGASTNLIQMPKIGGGLGGYVGDAWYKHVLPIIEEELRDVNWVVISPQESK